MDPVKQIKNRELWQTYFLFLTKSSYYKGAAKITGDWQNLGGGK